MQVREVNDFVRPIMRRGKPKRRGAKLTNKGRPTQRTKLAPLKDVLRRSLSRLPSNAPFREMKRCIDACNAFRTSLLLSVRKSPRLSKADRERVVSSLVDEEVAVRIRRDQLLKLLDVIDRNPNSVEGERAIGHILECDRFLLLMERLREYRNSGTKPRVSSDTAKKSAAIVTAELSQLVVNDRVPIGICERLIAESAWWYGHPVGPVRAPNHVDNLYYGMYGCQIDFGANSFLVESAVSQCVAKVRATAEMIQLNGEIEKQSILRSSMAICVRYSVANYEGVEFESAYPCDENGFMHFGTAAISVEDFVQWMWIRTKAHTICE